MSQDGSKPFHLFNPLPAPEYYDLRRHVRFGYNERWVFVMALVVGFIVLIGGTFWSLSYAGPSPSSDAIRDSILFGALASLNIVLLYILLPRILSLLLQERTQWSNIEKGVKYLEEHVHDKDDLDLIEKMATNDRGGVQTPSLLINLIWAFVVVFVASIGALQVNWGLVFTAVILFVILFALISAEQDAANIVILQAVTVYRYLTENPGKLERRAWQKIKHAFLQVEDKERIDPSIP